jgi:ABC-type antimicrobial peptide transport system permease subunit
MLKLVQRLETLIRGVAGFLVGIPIFYLLAVIFGAPLLEYVSRVDFCVACNASYVFRSNIQRTALWSGFMSSLAVVPASCTIGLDLEEWRRLFLMAGCVCFVVHLGISADDV